VDILPSALRRKLKEPETPSKLYNFIPDNQSTTAALHRRTFAKSSYIAVILWPDGSVFKMDLPHCIKRARYVYTPANAQIAHLAEYLLVRAEIEAGWKHRNNFNVDFMGVEDETDDFELFWSKVFNTSVTQIILHVIRREAKESPYKVLSKETT
jgi:hypothetical protein